MKKLRQAAKELNAQTPIDTGDGSTLISVHVLQNIFTYHYRLSDWANNKLPGISELQQLSDEMMLDYSCKHVATNQMINSGAVLIWHYSAIDGSFLVSSRMTKEILDKKC